MARTGQQLKLSNFYGDKIARPYVLLDKDGKPVQDRVDAPHVNDALLEWASRVPVKLGGGMMKPVYDGPEPKSLREPRTDFQIFFQEQYDDVLAANPSLFAADRKAMLSAASIYWRETLSAEERAEYRRRSTEEKKATAEAVAEAEEANPRFKSFREKMQKYKESMHNILTATKVSTGPLWRAQRQRNAKYRVLEEQQAAAEAEEEGQGGLAGASKAKKAAAKGKGKGRGGKKAAQKRLVQSSDDSDEEDVEEAEAAAAAEAMQNLQLATAKKGGKAAPAKASKAPAKKAAAPAKGKAAKRAEPEEAVYSSSSEEEEEEWEEEEEEEEEKSPQQQRAGRRSRSGAAVLAERVTATGKGRRGYTGTFDLPPSQSATPAKARAGGSSKAASKAAALPSKSPGKRARSTRAAAVAELEATQPLAEGSPAKKPRRSARK